MKILFFQLMFFIFNKKILNQQIPERTIKASTPGKKTPDPVSL